MEGVRAPEVDVGVDAVDEPVALCLSGVVESEGDLAETMGDVGVGIGGVLPGDHGGEHLRDLGPASGVVDRHGASDRVDPDARPPGGPEACRVEDVLDGPSVRRKHLDVGEVDDIGERGRVRLLRGRHHGRHGRRRAGVRPKRRQV